MDPPPSHEKRAAEGEPEEAENGAGAGGDRRQRMLVKKMGRERLINYVQDIIKKQIKPLHEIIKEHALPFLPAKSLHRLRSVSASWKNHISNPFFSHTQSITHRTLSGLFVNPKDPDFPSYYLPFDPPAAYSVPDPSLDFLPEDWSRIVASSRGLVCCRSGPLLKGQKRWYGLFNPATKDCSLILEPTKDHDGVVLVFNPSNLNFSADYHFICCFSVEAKMTDSTLFVTRKFEVFSSRDWKWQVSARVMTCQEPLVSRCGVSAGGKAYWKTKNSIVFYDPGTDACGQMPIPYEAVGKAWEIGEVNGKLCCVTCGSASESMWAVEIFVEERVGGGPMDWTKIKSFDEVAGVDVRPLMFEGEEVLLWVDGAVVGRNMATGNGRLLVHPDAAAVDNSECLPYISSLVSVRKLFE